MSIQWSYQKRGRREKINEKDSYQEDRKIGIGNWTFIKCNGAGFQTE